MADIKYTTDGKKVRVIGNLNTEEKIVQEIFVSESGVELPSGENFVVKFLHDEPVVSWKESKLKDIEERFERTEKKYKKMTTELEKEYENLIMSWKEKSKCLKPLIPESSVEHFEFIDDFITNKFKYVVFHQYSCLEIYTFEEFEKELIDCCHHFEGVKLLTLFGGTDGSLNWRMNEYRDGSGGIWYQLYFCYTYSEAKNLSLDIINEQEEYSDSNVDFFKKHDLRPDKSKFDKYVKKKISLKEKSIQKLEGNLEEQKNQKLEFERMLET